ncbi:MAG: T9SS type A sorting domain-containing protein [Bacteroidales bacterium]|nr:T9SS type A sorting domain-containing protein [Bacteroidales bacterium]
MIGSIGVSDTLVGYAKIFKLESDTWLQLGSTIQSTSMNDYFGSSVSISSEGNRIAIGAPQNSEIGLYAGKVSIFEYSGTDWIQIGQSITGENTGDHCGIVHLSGNGQMLVVGETGNNQNGINSGKCRVFSFLDNQWNQVEQSIYGSIQGDWFGSSIGLNEDGSVLIIGAPCNDINGIESGQAKVFQLNTYSDVVTLKSETFKVFPNPSKAVFNISTIEAVQVNVFSSNGDFLFSTNKKEVDLKNYSKGIYYLRVLEKSIVKTFRVILE